MNLCSQEGSRYGHSSYCHSNFCILNLDFVFLCGYKFGDAKEATIALGVPLVGGKHSNDS
jgi:hypothetical protein